MSEAVIPRYLVAFDPKGVPHYFADVLIVGGGLAGLRAAMAVDPSLSVLVVTKDKIEQSNSNYAQGGIAGVLHPADRFENHVADTIMAGGALCDRSVVEMVVREAPNRIGELIEWGSPVRQGCWRVNVRARRGTQRSKNRARSGRLDWPRSHAGGDRTGPVGTESPNLGGYIHTGLIDT